MYLTGREQLMIRSAFTCDAADSNSD